MSSLDQDRLLAGGSEPATGSASTLATARVTSRRPAEKKATSTVPAQRQGTAQHSGSTPTVTDGGPRHVRTRRAAGAKAAATGAAGTLASRAKAATNATAKAASAKAATVGAATAKAAVAAKSAAGAKPAGRPAATRAKPAKPAPVAKPLATPKQTTAKPAAAKAATAKPAAGKSAAAEPAAGKAATAKVAPLATASVAEPVAPEAARVALTAPARPTPYKRTPPADVVVPVAEPLAAVDDVAQAPAVVADVSAERPRSRFLRRRPPSIRRRPAVYLAAALVGAMSVSAVSSDGPSGRAIETMSHSVSVAKELGIHAAPAQAITDTDATELLGELAVSRNVRDAERAAAAQAQAEADRVAAEAAAQAAAEAARPKVVLPVAGARLTSGFGPRWGTLHAGIDFAAPMQTPEYAAMDGVVLEAGPASGFGLAVYIQHANGDVTVYGHMDSILVQAGQVVRAGDTIALLGNRGQSTGPHLHFEVHAGGLDGEKIDPLPWLRANGVAI